MVAISKYGQMVTTKWFLKYLSKLSKVGPFYATIMSNANSSLIG